MVGWIVRYVYRINARGRGKMELIFSTRTRVDDAAPLEKVHWQKAREYCRLSHIILTRTVAGQSNRTSTKAEEI